MTAAFGRMFDETMYLANGMIPVVDYYQDYLCDIKMNRCTAAGIPPEIEL